MKNNLVLIGENDNLVVERFKLGNKVVEFVHDTETSENYFPQKILCDLFGIKISALSEHLNNYLNSILSFSGNPGKALIRLKTKNTTQRVKFYGFDAVTYLAYRINTDEAIYVRNIVSNILNTMFNVATGKTDLDTKISKLENMYEVENQKATDYLKAIGGE